MTLFRFPAYEEIARQLRAVPSLRLGQFNVARYENGELRASVQGPITGEHCLVLGTIAPPDEQMLSFLLLTHTLKKEGANKVTALVPYLAYTRQDKDKTGESLATAWSGSLLKSSGIDQVITVDVHSKRDKQLFPLPLVSISTAQIFAEAIRNHRLTDATIVAPDNGAIYRCEAVKRAAGMPVGDTPYFEKKRTEKGIVHSDLVGRTGARVVIIDDMLDTGGTLVSACEKLREANVEEIYILVTHGLFTGSHWTKLWSLGVRRILCTDTVPLRAGIETTNITILSVVPLLAEELSAMDKEIQRGTAGG
jgi:ribose-phosphate pyrophosphokinase